MKSSTIIAILLMLIVAAGAFALLELRQSVTVEIDGQPLTFTTWGWTVGDVLTSASIAIAEGDIVTPNVDERPPEDGIIHIQRAFWVLLNADGQTQSLWTTEEQPSIILETAGVELGPDDLLLWNGIPISSEEPLPEAESHSLQIQRASTVSVTDGLQREQIKTTGPTLADALWELGITIYSSDHIDPSLESPLQGQTVNIELQRAREVTIQHAEGSIQTRVLTGNVGEALAQAGLSLQGLDYSIPPEEASIPISNTIRVVRVHEEVSLETEPLAFGFLPQPLPELELDQQQVVQVGEYGLTAKRVRVIYEDNVEVAQQTEDQWVARESKPRILGYGTNINIQTTQTADGPIEYWRAVEVYASTYSPCRLGVPNYCSEITSSGKVLKKGIIAVTLEWYRYMQGLPVYVPNYGFGSIEDVGGGLPDRHWIDLGYSDDDWVGWGGWMTIYFLTPVPENIMWILE